MGNGTELGRVRALGSAHSGAHHWLVQRYTAIVAASAMSGVSTDQKALLSSSYPAPVSSTKWRRPEAM